MVVATSVAILALLGLNVPYFALSPGPTQNVVELIRIDGAEVSAVGGEFLLTTVSLRPIRVFQGFLGWLDSATDVVERRTYIPPGSTREDADRRSSHQMRESQINAAAAALALVGYDVKVSLVGVRVESIRQDAPAAEVLREGDIIESAAGETVGQIEDLVRAVGLHQVGDVIELTVLRGEERITVESATVGRPEDPSDPVIGVVVANFPEVELPVGVDIDSMDIGGPSAGLMYALGIVDLLDGRDLAGGRMVAGTGTITIDGEIGLVGGVIQKVRAARKAGAELFLVPADELDDACRVAGDLQVAGVTDLGEAVNVLLDEAFALERGC